MAAIDPRDVGTVTQVDAQAGAAAVQPEIRIAAIRETSGALTDAYGSDYLEALREDWPM